jgi:methionine aminotransferase
MITPKTLNFAPGYFNNITQMASKANAVDLASDHSSLTCHPHLMELLHEELSLTNNTPLSPFGLELLREKIATRVNAMHGRIYDPESEVTITSGSRQGLYGVIAAFVRDGDEVIVIEPAAEYLVPAIELNGGHPVFVKLKGPDFHMEWEDLQRAITAQTRMILIHSPHNPTGWVMSELDTIRLQKIVAGTKIVLVSDETHVHQVYDNEGHQSMAAYPRLAEQSVIIASTGEPFNAGDWMVAHCLAPADLMRDIRKVFHVMTQPGNSPMQHALARLVDDKDIYNEARNVLEHKRDFLTLQMEQTRFKALISKGSIYQLYNYSDVSEEPDRDFASFLLQQHQVAVTPISLFYHDKPKNHLLRFNFARPDEELALAAERLSKV